jgi:beta-fructofuranosidase/levanase
MWQGWDVTNFVNQTAVLGIADFNTGAQGWGHLIVGEIVFSESLAQDQKVNWVDYGPDYYAAATYNGLPGYERVAVGWANNWAYGAEIPTSPWRSSMSVMRKYPLATVHSKVTLIQEPCNLASIEKSSIYANRWATLPGPPFDLPVTGKSLNVTLTFDVISTVNHTAQEDTTIRLFVRSNKNGSQVTVIGYDTSTQQLFIDRTNSGDANFDPVFPGTYSAALILDTHGSVRLRVLVDWSLVEVFGGQGNYSADIFQR